ncbi:MAG: hypothetical protein HN392_12695, partial [Anaerolineae bacterium]|nr:hypothetical protein [Anaerolineae bacterium]
VLQETLFIHAFFGEGIVLSTILFLLGACQSQSEAAPTSLPAPTEVVIEVPTQISTEIPTEVSTEVPLETATLAPTEEPLLEPTALPTETLAPILDVDSNLFGAVNMADAPTGFILDPIAAFIFEAELQKRVDTGEIIAFQVESFGIYPRGDGTFYAEIFYALEADSSFWPEDFGTQAEDGWTRGKCTLFDFLTTEEEFQLRNKRVCN